MIIYSNGEKIEVADGVSKVEFETELKKKQDSATAITMEEVIKAISEAAIQTQDVYTIEEQRVGTWIDGKPFYRRVIIGLSPSSINVWSNVGDPIENCEPKLYKGYILDGSHHTSLPYNDGNLICALGWDELKENFICFVNRSDILNQVLILIGYYTKTTDQATIEIPSVAVSNNLTVDAISQSTFAFDPLDQQVGILPDGRSIFEHIIQTAVSITEPETIVASMPNIELVAPITGIVDGQNGSEWYSIPGSYSDFQYGLSYVKETGDIKLYASSTSISEKTLRLFVRYVLPAEKDISTLEEP